MTPHGLPPITPSMPPFTFASAHPPHPVPPLPPGMGAVSSPTVSSFAAATAMGVGMAVLSPDEERVWRGHQEQQRQIANLQQMQEQVEQGQGHGQMVDPLRSSVSGDGGGGSDQSASTQRQPLQSVPMPVPMPMPMAPAIPNGAMMTPFSPGLVMSPGAFYGRAGSGLGGVGVVGGSVPIGMPPPHMMGLGTPTFFGPGVPSPGSTVNGAAAPGAEPSGYFDHWFSAGYGAAPPPVVDEKSEKEDEERQARVEGLVLKDREPLQEEEELGEEESGAGDHAPTLSDSESPKGGGLIRTHSLETRPLDSKSSRPLSPRLVRGESAPDPPSLKKGEIRDSQTIVD